MEITVAKNAGFCFGVKRATDSLEAAIKSKSEGERIFTLGTLIHNDTYNAMLKDKGVRVTSIDEVRALSESASSDAPGGRRKSFSERDLTASTFTRGRAALTSVPPKRSS